MLTALLEYLDLLAQVAESGPANAGPAGLWAPALSTLQERMVPVSQCTPPTINDTLKNEVTIKS